MEVYFNDYRNILFVYIIIYIVENKYKNNNTPTNK